MFKKIIQLLLIFILYGLNGQAQSNKNQVYLSSGDTVIVRSFKKDRIVDEKYFLKDTQVLHKKYYYKKSNYGYFIKDPRASNKKAFIIKDFWNNGNLRIDGSSLDGKKQNGSYKTFYEDGKPQCDCNYLNGKREGRQIIRYSNGQLWREIIYKNGTPWNILSLFDKNGNELNRGSLQNGTGKLYIYDENAQLTEIEHYQLSVLTKTEKIKNHK